MKNKKSRILLSYQDIGGMLRGRPLQQTLLAFAVIPIITVLSIVGILTSQSVDNNIHAEEGNQLAAEARYFSEIVDLTIGKKLVDIKSRAALLAELDLQNNPDKLAIWINAIQRTIPEYTWVGFASPEGSIIAASQKILLNQSVREREWFQKGLRQPTSIDVHEARLLEPYLPKRQSETPWRFIDVTAPVFHQDGRLMGVLGAHLSWDWLVAQHRRFSESLQRQRSAEIIVAGPDGTPRLLASELEKTNLQAQSSFQQANLGKTGWTKEVWPDQQTYLVGYTRNSGYGDDHQLGWVTLIRLPIDQTAVIAGPINAGIWTLITLVSLIFIVGSLALIRKTLRPVQRLVTEINQIAQHGGRVNLSEPMPKEFHILGSVTNQLIQTMEAQRSSDQAKTRFLADMSHEIRTPLNGLLGHSELLKTRLSSGKDRYDIDQIIRCAKDLQVLVDDILDLSAIEENRLRLEKKPFRLTDVIEMNLDIFRPLAVQKGIEFNAHLDFHSDLAIIGDQLRFGQILRNLLSNAIKFTSQGSVELSIHCADGGVVTQQSAIPSPPVALELVVSDTGIGLTQAQQEIVFGRFEQAETSISARYGGSGLGLSVTRALTEAMGGTISLNSALHVGTHVMVVIPFEQAIQEPVQLSIAKTLVAVPTDSDGRATPKLKILVVDDIATNREILVRWLEHLGHQVAQAATGHDSIQKAAKTKYDVICMDIDLPDMNGRAATAEIRGAASASRYAIIIAISGYAFDHDISASKAAGIDTHLSKPIRFESLNTLLASLPSRSEN
jgi:signal transduction histidine kinase/CheY-like chemotaxis protein